MQKKPPILTKLATLILLGLGAGMAAIFAYLGREEDIKARAPEFIALSLAAGILYLIAVYLIECLPLGPTALVTILGSAVVFRLLALPSNPSLSEDVYRYQWEGRVQRAHYNPYVVFPAMQGLQKFQDLKHPLETGSVTPTVYPPLSEMAFARIKSLAGYKRAFTAFDLGSLAILVLLLSLLKQPLHRALAYAWNPAVIVSFAMCGHHDSLAVFLLLTTNLFIIVGRPALSIAFLALSFLAKFFPALLLPIFLKRKRGAVAYAGIFMGLVGLGYLPYLSAGRQFLRGLTDYAAGWEANDSLFRLIRLAGNSKAQGEVVAGFMVLALVAYVLKKGLEPLHASLLLTAGPLLVSPNAFPWYFTWSIPFLCFYTSRAWLLMSVTAVLGYAPVVAYVEGQPYRDSAFILALQYVPVYLWLAYEARRTVLRARS